MARQLFLILVLAFCAPIRGDIELIGQPMNCTDAVPVDGKGRLIDFGELLIGTYPNGEKGFNGSIDILQAISSLEVRYLYVERENNQFISFFSDDLGDICSILNGLLSLLDTSSPASNFIERIQSLSPNLFCVPAIEAKTYDMNGVTLNQEQLRNFRLGRVYDIEIEFETPDEYSCVRLRGNVVANTVT